jgi:hypothetical protein
MNEIFVSSFITMFDAVAKNHGYCDNCRNTGSKKIVKQEYIKGLSEITVIVLLPSLIFTKTISTFKPDETVGWWILPLIGMILPLLGFF